MAIAINGSGTVTGISVGGLPDGIVDTDMLANGAATQAKRTYSTGEVIQWKRLHRGTGQWVTTSSAFQVVTNLNASITPTATDNIIYCQYNLYVRVYENNNDRARGELEIRNNMSSDNFNTDRANFIYQAFDYGDSGLLIDTMNTISYQCTAPNTTAIEFGVYGKCTAGEALEVNPSNANSSDNSIILMEIQA